MTFPFRRIEKLAALPPNERRVMGFVTFVYHLFPNALVTVLSNHTNLLVLEPLSVDRTSVVSYSLTNRTGDRAEALEAAERDAHFTAIGANEDRAIVSAIQRGVASDANESFVFGRFESAIVHFHERWMLSSVEDDPSATAWRTRWPTCVSWLLQSPGLPGVAG